MQKEAEENAEADKKKKEEVDLRNDVEQLLFTTDKTLKELKGKVSDDEIKKAEDAKDALKKAQEENNLDDMKAKRDDLNKIVQDLSVKMYEQAAKEQQAKGGDAADQATGDAKKDDDNTVDGDFEEVDPDKDKK